MNTERAHAILAHIPSEAIDGFLTYMRQTFPDLGSDDIEHLKESARDMYSETLADCLTPEEADEQVTALLVLAASSRLDS